MSAELAQDAPDAVTAAEVGAIGAEGGAARLFAVMSYPPEADVDEPAEDDVKLLPA